MKKRDKIIVGIIVAIIAIVFVVRLNSKVDTIVPQIKEDSTLTKSDTLKVDSLKVDTTKH